MKFLIVLSLLFSTSLLANNKYGGDITLKKSLSLQEATKDFKKYQNKEVLVSAKVGKVCQSKGCWMTLESEKGDIRVTFKDYSFFVPMSLIGKKVLIQGKLQGHTMGVEEARHYAKDAGQDPSKVTKPVTEYRMVASAVQER